jgi:hypothetical protein
MIDEEQNTYIVFTAGGIDIFGLSDNAEYTAQHHTGGGLLPVQDTRAAGGCL